MTYIANRDYNVELLLGNIAGRAAVSINGHNDDQTTTRITVAPTLTTADIDQSGIHASAATVKVASTDTNDTSAGTGLRTLRLEGLDSSGNAQTETITLNGQTEVESANTYSAVNNFRGLTVGSNNTSAGEIWIGAGTFTSGVPATKYFVGERNHNKGLTGYYTVPASKTLVVKGFVLTVVGSNKEVEITVEVSTDGSFWVVEDELSAVSGTEIFAETITIPKVAAGSHIRIRGEAAGSGTELTATLDCELVDD